MAEILWQPSDEMIQSSNMARFMRYVNERYNTDFETYDALYQWSVANIPDFWAALWDFIEVKASVPYAQVIDDVAKMPGAEWFLGTRLNFAENLLRYRDDRTALIFWGEDQVRRRMTYAELYREVAQIARALRQSGVTAGDRVVGFIPNMPQAVGAQQAGPRNGGTRASGEPGLGLKCGLDRVGPLRPTGVV